MTDITAVAWPTQARNLVAILRGVKPDEVEAIGDALVAAGITLIEVPLNSPDPFLSIERLVRRLGGRALVGAGTVLSVADVMQLAVVGGRLMVSPNVDPAVLAAAAAQGMVTMPGVFTPSEALLALKSGASGLKFFPASALGAGGIAAIRAILPADTMIGAVGGVSEVDFAAYAKAGVRAFGLGSSLYKPGASAADVAARAAAAVAAYDSTFGGA